MAKAQTPFPAQPAAQGSSKLGNQSKAEALAQDELRVGAALARRGQFSEAIPHLLAARARLGDDYRANFNLALCYIGTDQLESALPILAALRAQGHDNADVNNLLAQILVAKGEDGEAFTALERASSFTPENEKLYLFVSDACMAKQNYELGLQVVDLGLKNLPDSAWLHYERGMFLALLDQLDSGKNELILTGRIAPASDVAFVAATQEAMLEGHLKEAVRIAREGLGKGHQHFLLLTLLGEALLRSGIIPGQPEFQEAQNVLEKSTVDHPNDQGSQLALGKIYLLAGRLDDAILHLEIARSLNPSDPSAYSHLAVAYRRQGKVEKAEDALTVLAQLNQKQAEKIRQAPGDRKTGYGAGAPGKPGETHGDRRDFGRQ